MEIEQELAKDMKAGRKISNMRLKSLQDASKAMKKHPASLTPLSGRWKEPKR